MKRVILYYFCFLFFFLTIFSSGILDSIDGLQYLSVARNIYYQGKPSAPSYEYNTRKNVHMSVYTGKDGNTYSLTGLGYSLAYVPAVFVTDIVYKIYGVVPPIHFPLENDWLILLTSSFTNAFFGAMLGVILFVYFILLGLNKKQALLLSFISLISTNLFVYTKHAMVHMMFVSFMMLSFLMLKIYAMNRRKYALMLAGAAYGVVSITYNPTFLLLLPAFVLYYFLLIKPKNIKILLIDVIPLVLGFIPFVLIYLWFENLRALPGTMLANPSYTSFVGGKSSLPVSVFIEGLHGQLFSFGRSIFVYSPLLILIVFFWHKIKKRLTPELFTFILLSIIYIVFYALQYRVGSVDQGIVANWHGELSWGPRYLTPLIPIGMLIVGSIYLVLSKRLKYLVFYPLMILGIYIELLGVLIPYQTKSHNLPWKIYINQTEYFADVYSDLLPRHTPIINMSKNLIKLVQNFPKTYEHGVYNVRYYDGIDFPFNVGGERWRSVVDGKGYISFDNNNKNPIKELAFGLVNHPISESSESAKLQFVLNGEPLFDSPVVLAVAQRELVKIPVPPDVLKPYNNNLVIQVDYDVPMQIKFSANDNVTIGYKQILGFLSFDINGQRQNMESLDIPYVSPLGPKMMGVTYQNWGGTNKDPWRLWSLHSQIFERVPDLWWLRNLYHWDIPRKLILSLFGFNLFCFVLFAYKLKSLFKQNSKIRHK